MKKWEKVKYPLLIGMITIVMSLIRFLMFASPTWIDTGILFPLLFIAFCLGEIGAQIFMIALCAGAVMLVPCQWLWDEGQEKLRRFLIRPAIAVVIMLCVSGLLISRNRVWEKRYHEKRVTSSYQQVREFTNIAHKDSEWIVDFSQRK